MDKKNNTDDKNNEWYIQKRFIKYDELPWGQRIRGLRLRKTRIIERRI